MTFFEEVMKFAAEHDIYEDLYWKSDLTVFVNCNDVFFWGCADCLEITPENFDILKQSIKDAGEIYGSYLFCARVYEMRPQNAIYTSIPEDLWDLFDACGEERPSDFGNPYPIPGSKEWKEKFDAKANKSL